MLPRQKWCISVFLDLDKHNQDKTAIKDDSGYELSYRDVCDTVRAFEELSLPRCVVFCLCESVVN